MKNFEEKAKAPKSEPEMRAAIATPSSRVRTLASLCGYMAESLEDENPEAATEQLALAADLQACADAYDAMCPIMRH